MKLNQSTRILILLALIVAAVAVWYSLFFSSGQTQPAAETTVVIPHKTNKKVEGSEPVAVTTSARALQVLPIPFLVTEAPEEAPLETAAAPAAAAYASTNVPLNPFVPLRVEAAPAPEKPEQVPESEKPVLVTPGEELTPNIPVPKTITPENGSVTPPPVTLGKGTLPIKLSPLEQEVSATEPLSQALAENQPAEEPAVDGNDAAEEEATENAQPEAEETPPPPPPNPLAEWAAQQQLQLDGVALGPVGVAIFKTASGYLALPVGQTFPDKNVLVKTITAERVLLVDGSGTNTLTLELGGGE